MERISAKDMAAIIKILPIDDQLRVILFGIECALKVEFNPTEIEHVFRDSASILTVDKKYTFCTIRGVSISGHIVPAEPTDLWLNVDCKRPIEPPLEKILDRAELPAYRIRRR